MWGKAKEKKQEVDADRYTMCRMGSAPRCQSIHFHSCRGLGDRKEAIRVRGCRRICVKEVRPKRAPTSVGLHLRGRQPGGFGNRSVNYDSIVVVASSKGAATCCIGGSNFVVVPRFLAVGDSSSAELSVSAAKCRVRKGGKA